MVFVQETMFIVKRRFSKEGTIQSKVLTKLCMPFPGVNY